MMKKTKSVAKSVRMTEEVANYILSFEGEGFNQKLENLVLFCMKSEKTRRHDLEDLDRRIADRQSVLYDQLINIESALRVSARSAAELRRWLDKAAGILPGDAEQ